MIKISIAGMKETNMSTSTHDLFDFLKRQIGIFQMNIREFVEE